LVANICVKLFDCFSLCVMFGQVCQPEISPLVSLTIQAMRVFLPCAISALQFFQYKVTQETVIFLSRWKIAIVLPDVDPGVN